MPYRRSRSRRRAARRRRNRLLLLALAAGGLMCALLVASSSLFAPGEASDKQGAHETPIDASATPPPDTSPRTLYPFSVVPGGVSSREALVTAIADPVVAEHYASIDIAHARVASVTGPRRAYVSYRVGDQVYWTKHTVALHEGERVLTDGVREIRARCGNRISDTPQSPTAAEEPDVTEFDRALAPVAGGPVALITIPSRDAFRMESDGFSAGRADLPPDGFVRPPSVDSSEGEPSLGSLAFQNIPLGAGSPGSGSDDAGAGSVSEGETSGQADGGSPEEASPGSTRLDPDGPVFPPIEGPAPMAPIPEPGSIILVGTGLAGCALRAWRRRRDRP